MTTVTYGHAFLHDCETLVTNGGATSKWTETDANNITTWATDGYDIITATVAPTANGQTALLAYHLPTNPYTTTYTTILHRWKTSDSAANGVKAGLYVYYTDTTTDLYNLGYSTTWKRSVNTLDSAKYVDKIGFWVTSDGATSGTHYCYFDFALICQGVFTFPNDADVTFELPSRYATLDIPQRDGDITQNLGTHNATVNIHCNLDVWDAYENWKRPQATLTPKTDYMKGQALLDICAYSGSEPWQWLDLGTGLPKFKATLETAPFNFKSDNHTLDLTFKEKRLGSAVNETTTERYMLDQT